MYKICITAVIRCKQQFNQTDNSELMCGNDHLWFGLVWKYFSINSISQSLNLNWICVSPPTVFPTLYSTGFVEGLPCTQYSNAGRCAKLCFVNWIQLTAKHMVPVKIRGFLNNRIHGDFRAQEHWIFDKFSYLFVCPWYLAIDKPLWTSHESQLTGSSLSQDEGSDEGWREREEVAQASEHCFRLLTRPSCSLSSTCWCNDSSGQSWAAKHPNTLLSPSDSHRRHPVFKSLRRRASLVCFHSTFSAAGYFIQLSRPLDAGCCHSKHSVEALTRSNLASSSLPYVRALHKFSLSLSIDSNEMPTQPPPIKPQQ